ncbi:helix-turn-helix domain-containing protein [Thiolapillus sp.]|uniref:helix-turn-helix domain-containing protein n=1 Tax=Thiolapillus sp. TaxID=2017437 RepID=UPI003AF69E5D
MSILARDWAYSQALAAPAKFVLVALAEHVSGEGRACWHSVSRLARMTGYAERTVRRALRALEAAGLVRIERRPGRPALYSLNLSTTPARESGDPGLSGRRTEKNRNTHTTQPGNLP